MKYVISCDWFQVYGHCQSFERAFSYTECSDDDGLYWPLHYDNDLYVVRKVRLVTPIYKDNYVIMRNGVEVAELAQSPRISKMHSLSSSIRLKNRTLYHKGYIKLLYDIMSLLKFSYKGITRLDVCLDCNELYGGRNPRSFVRGLLAKKAGTVGFIYRKGTRKGAAYFERSPMGETYFSSISWGSRTSDYTAKIYNKTQELMEKGDKPWIRDVWRDNGLVSEIAASWYKLEASRKQKLVDNGGTLPYINKEVWRFEISIKANGKPVVEMDTGVLFRLSPKFVDGHKAIQDIFYMWARKAFDFRICTGQKNFRHYPPLQIFPVSSAVPYMPMTLNEEVGSGRMEKIVANKLAEMKKFCYRSDYPMAESIDASEQYFRERSRLKDKYVSLMRDLFNQYDIPSMPTNQMYKELIDKLIYILDPHDPYHDWVEEMYSIMHADGGDEWLWSWLNECENTPA